MYRSASAISLSGYVRSIAGFTVPAASISAQGLEVGPVDPGEEEGDVPAARLAGQEEPGDVAQRAEHLADGPPTSTTVASRLEHAGARAPRPSARDVEHEVVPAVAPGEVLARVVDDVVGAERAHEVDLAVLHTAVTSAPSALAICTAKVPTPPEAPLTSTR